MPVFNSGAVRTGGGIQSSGSHASSTAVRSIRDQWIDSQMSTPAIGSNVVSQFVAEPNSTTQGVDVTFRITDATGIKSVSLLRAAVMDIKQASVLQTWAAIVANFTWSDTDKALQSSGEAFYWLRMEPLNTNGKEQVAGPQFILLNPSLLPPLALTGISASHGAAANGQVLVTCNLSSIPSGDSIKIYVAGYEGNPAQVAVAQKTSSPLQFYLQQTGETVTIKAVAVSRGGAESASGPTCTLTLNSAATVPASVQGVSVTQISSGNQVSWPASLELGVTQYRLYRGQRGAGFGGASLLATIAATGAGTVLYLDTAGLTGDFEYYVIAVSGVGSSAAGLAANALILYSSAQLPPNTTANQVSTGLIDSLDTGASASIRIYGPGGVGTSWTKYFGYGPATRPAGTISGLAYNTKFYVMFQVAANVYLASTTYADSLPDGYEWIGTVTTSPSGGGSAATAGAAINTYTGGVAGVYPITYGYGYGSASVSTSGGGGSGANVIANCTNGQVSSYTVVSPGSGYTSNPTVTVTKTSDYTGGAGAATGGARYVVNQ